MSQAYDGGVIVSELLGERTEQFISEMVTMLKHSLVEHVELDAAVAQTLAEEVTDAICKAFGGTDIYIPQGRKSFSTKRRVKVWQEFTGNNHQALAQKHGLTSKTVYKIIREMTAEVRKRSQKEMDFGGNNHG